MKVILTERVATLGNIGEIVKVSEGFGRNYLIPRKLAVLADKSMEKQIANQKRALAKKIDAEKTTARGIKAKLDGMKIEMVKRVGANGKLYGAVTTTEISKELASRNLEVEKRVLSLDKPIKGLGTFNVKAKFFNDVEANFQVLVSIDPAQAEEMKKRDAEAAKAKEEAAIAEAKAREEAAANGETEVQKKGELTEEQRLKEEADRILRS